MTRPRFVATICGSSSTGLLSRDMRIARFAAGLLLALSLVGASAARAGAADCLAKALADVRAYNYGGTNVAAKATLLVHGGSAYDGASGGHINETLWDGTGSTDMSTWMELGYTHGFEGNTELTWYWADTRPGYSYFEHSLSHSISVGTRYIVKLEYEGNSTWKGFIAGDDANAVSYPNASWAGALQAGLESTSQCSNMGSSSSPVEANSLKREQSFGWIDSWPSSTILYSGGGATVDWTTTYVDSENWL